MAPTVGVFMMVAGGIVAGVFLIFVEIAYKKHRGLKEKELELAKTAADRWRGNIEVGNAFSLVVFRSDQRGGTRRTLNTRLWSWRTADWVPLSECMQSLQSTLRLEFLFVWQQINSLDIRNEKR